MSTITTEIPIDKAIFLLSKIKLVHKNTLNYNQYYSVTQSIIIRDR